MSSASSLHHHHHPWAVQEDPEAPQPEFRQQLRNGYAFTHCSLHPKAHTLRHVFDY